MAHTFGTKSVSIEVVFTNGDCKYFPGLDQAYDWIESFSSWDKVEDWNVIEDHNS